MPEFEVSLAASIASAKAKLAEREQAQRAAEAAERQRSQAVADKFAEVKSRAMRFKNNHLEQIFRKVQRQLNQEGFHFIGDYINDEGPNQGRVGNTLENGESCFILAAIDYGLDGSTARVEAQTTRGSCYSASQAFDENASQSWFEASLAQAVGKLLESGEVPVAGMVRYRGTAV